MCFRLLFILSLFQVRAFRMAKCPALQTNLPASLLYSNLSSFRVPLLQVDGSGGDDF